MSAERARSLLDRRFDEGVLDAAERRELNALLEAHPEARSYADSLAQLERGLEDGAELPDAWLERVVADGVARAVEESAADATPVAPVRRLPWRGGVVAALALAAGLLFVVWPGDGMQTRDGGVHGRRAWVSVFVKQNEGTQPLGAKLPGDAGLLFAYTNLKDSPARFLAIAGRDAAGRLHWYHPAWTDPAARPRSIAVDAGVADIELKSAVFAEHAAGPLEICALFTREALDIASVDAAMEKGGASWPEAEHRDCHRSEVRP